MATWGQARRGQRVLLGLVHIDIAGSSSLRGTGRARKEAKSIFRDSMEAIAGKRGGKLFSWAGDGGAFMFWTGLGKAFDDLALAAIEMLGILPVLNLEVATRTDLSNPLKARISCDAGVADYDPDPTRMASSFIDTFLKNERSISIEGTVCITENVKKELSTALQGRFSLLRNSAKLKCAIYKYNGADRGRHSDDDRSDDDAPPGKSQKNREHRSGANSKSAEEKSMRITVDTLKREVRMLEKELANSIERLRKADAKIELQDAKIRVATRAYKRLKDLAIDVSRSIGHLPDRSE
jgi:hypothetical protein